MANPSVTNTFVNGTTADATEVNQNFTDIINGITDGTKDLSISALTCAGAATLNGNVTLGNASADDLTVNASLASHIVPKTDATYDIGSSSIGIRYAYFGGNSQRVGITASGSTTATYNLTLPTATGAAGTGMITNGSGVLSWKPLAVDTSAKSAAYTITDGDGLRTILVTTGGTGRDVTLPTAADNTHRIITVKKVDSAASSTDIVTLKSDAAGETIDGVSGTTGIPICTQYDYITVQSDGSDWHILDERANIIVSVNLSANQTSLVSAATQKVQFDSEDIDTASIYDNATNYRVTPNKPGKYRISWEVSLDASGSSNNSIYNANSLLYKNGALHKYGSIIRHSSTGFIDGFDSNGSIIVEANGTTDYFEVFASVYLTSSTWNILTSGGAGTYLSVEYIGS